MPDSPANEPPARRARLGATLRLGVRLLAVGLLVAAVVGFLQPAGYRTPAGEVRYRIVPSWPGGGVVVPLGPAGEVRLNIHRAPFDVRADFTLSGTGALPDVGEAEDLVSGFPDARADVVEAFDSFAWSRLPWLVLLGVSAGLLLWLPRGRRALRRALLSAVIGVAGVAVVSGAFAGAALLTLDRSPAVAYSGLARHLPRAVALLRTVLEEGGANGAIVRDYLRGLQSVAGQFAGTGDGQATDGVVRLLLVSDVHDNIVGMRLASSLASSTTVPVDAVVLAGDLTQRGTRFEADIFRRFFDPGETPVLVVGGNHEDTPAMRVWRAAGYRVLEDDTTSVGELTLYGISDPLAWVPEATPDQTLLERAGTLSLERWQMLERYPHILVAHDVRQAEPIIDWTNEQQSPLTVLYGHDHKAAVTIDGVATLIDAGTSGAAGYESVGRDPNAAYTFQLVEFSQGLRPVALSVTTLRYTGLDGKSTAEFTPLSP